MPAAGETPDFLMEKLIELLIGELEGSDGFDAETLDSIRAVAESGRLGSVEAVKRAIAEPTSDAR
jgi:hypothetical protein